MKLTAFAALVAFTLLPVATPATADQLAPFTATLSNTTPLAYGMTAEQAAAALGTPLARLRGRPGEEVMVAIRSGGGSGFFPRQDRLVLQFRHRRLAGWKGDWGRNWMWQ
jgi:hypothetical protein